MSEWSDIPLVDVCVFSSGKAIKPGQDGLYKAFGSNGVIGASTEARHNKGIIIGRVGAYCGSVAVSYEPFWASDNTIVIEPKEETDLNFLYYLLRDAQLNQYAGGSAQPLVTQTTLKSLTFRVPTAEQRARIGAALRTFDDLIENNRRRIELLESMARAIYREWFVHFRFPGHEDVPMVDSDLGLIPEGWAVKLLDEITAQLPVGKRYDSKSSLPTGQVPILDQSVGGVMGYHNEVPGVRASLTSPVFTFANHTCAMRLMYEPFSVIQNVFPKVGRDGVATTLFAYHVGKDRQVIEDYKGHHPRWRETAVVSAPLAIQNQFTATIVPLHQRAEYISRSNATLITMRDLLLPKLVSGEIDVSDLEIDLSELDLVS